MKLKERKKKNKKDNDEGICVIKRKKR